MIGVGGAQGSGKTTLCRAFAEAHPRVAHFSLDDVYKTRAEREDYADVAARAFIEHDPPRRSRAASFALKHAIADKAKPILITRGPPGTHDLSLAKGLIARLHKPLETPLPQFDKARDDRAPEPDWPSFSGPADAVLIDGWCMGATLPPDAPTMNAIEKEDEAGLWRGCMLGALDQDYAPFFAAFDAMVYLQAPSWEIVRRWRGQQEEETLGRKLTGEEGLALDRFVMHYERITRAMLDGHHCAGWIVYLDDNRNVTRIEQRS